MKVSFVQQSYLNVFLMNNAFIKEEAFVFLALYCVIVLYRYISLNCPMCGVRQLR